jgi:predicted metalloprotease with PDZ domain
LFEVRCTVADPDSSGQRFRLPSWIPGSYLIREFARHFVSVRAEVEGQRSKYPRKRKMSGAQRHAQGPLTVIAQVYAYDLSVRAAYLDETRGYFNGPTVFLCPDGHAERPCRIEIVAPSVPTATPWRVATTLARIETSADGFGVYHAANYDELIDHPVEMSDFALASFDAGGAKHDVAVSGRQHADLDRLARDLVKICQWHCDLFGGAPGSPGTVRCLSISGDRGWRWLWRARAPHEYQPHLQTRRSSTAGIEKITESYRRFLGLASHEYFHAWNIKRIKPAAFVPYDLTRESYTRQLWAFEGITSYYDDLALARSRVIDTASYLELLGRTITTVLRNPGRHVQSIADSSFDAWIKYYRQDENTPNAVVSYYAKGSLVALALDLTVRGHHTSLDAVMRALWKRYGQAGIGVPEDGFVGLVSELAGHDLGDFFVRYVDGTDDPPLADLLAGVGVKFNLRPADDASDKGGGPSKSIGTDDAPRVSLGAKIATGTEAKLQHVYSGGAAERAGLAAGDILVAVEGLRASPETMAKMLTQRRPGDTIAVHAFRRDELLTTVVRLDEAPLDTCWLALDDNASAKVRAARDAWLSES